MARMAKSIPIRIMMPLVCQERACEMAIAAGFADFKVVVMEDQNAVEFIFKRMPEAEVGKLLSVFPHEFYLKKMVIGG